MRTLPKKPESLALDEIDERRVRQACARLVVWCTSPDGLHRLTIPHSGGQTAGTFCFAGAPESAVPRGAPGAGLRVFDQVEDPREKASLCIRPPDIDDCRVRQFLAKNIKDQVARILVEVIDCFVEHYPTRLVQQKPGEGELVLILGGQFPFPLRRDRGPATDGRASSAPARLCIPRS